MLIYADSAINDPFALHSLWDVGIRFGDIAQRRWDLRHASPEDPGATPHDGMALRKPTAQLQIVRDKVTWLNALKPYRGSAQACEG
jgi:hypothetical protein